MCGKEYGEDREGVEEDSHGWRGSTGRLFTQLFNRGGTATNQVGKVRLQL
jgi:hypothetical protein